MDWIPILTSITTAVISAGGAFLGAMLTNNKRNAIIETKLDNMKEDIQALSEHVNSHNNYGLKIASFETKFEELEKRVDKLENNKR